MVSKIACRVLQRRDRKSWSALAALYRNRGRLRRKKIWGTVKTITSETFLVFRFIVIFVWKYRYKHGGTTFRSTFVNICKTETLFLNFNFVLPCIIVLVKWNTNLMQHCAAFSSGPNKKMWWLTCNDNTCTIGRCTSFKYSWWWALAPETCRVTLQK